MAVYDTDEVIVPRFHSNWTALMTDLTNKEDIIRLAGRVKEEVGVPELIINNAGAYYFNIVEDRDYASWQRMIDLNIMGYLVMMAEFLADMKVET